MPVQRFSDLVRFARDCSPFYADLYADLPPEVNSLTDLPVVDQNAFWAANTLHDNRVLTAPLAEAVVYKTGGTTGTPRFSCYTREEWSEFVTAFGAGLVDAGLRPGHRVADLFYAGELYASFLFVLDSLAHAPVSNVRLPIGGGAPLESTVSALQDFGAHVVAGTPTTLCRLAEHLTSTGRRLPQVELLFFGGEALFSDQRRLLAGAFPNAEPRSLGYASVDGGLLGRPVAGPDTRTHRPFTPHTVVEILDETTGEPIREAGRPGRVVVTQLFRSLMPVIRYPAGDRAEWTDTEGGAFRVLGRAEEGVRVGPVSLYWDDATNAVAEADTGGLVTGTQLVVRRWEGRDGLILRLATAPEHDPGTLEVLAKAVVEGLNTARPLYPDSVAAGFVHPLGVEWTRHRDLVVNSRSGKLVRVLDERPTA
ncbi:AMP-dependent synthetase [Streptomyces sp. WM4235]|uniref:phenylacetate--CoA ligase family protein n=1 Tax=unclassified Streptomyces TaxID=2593676 RepID=UPI0003C94887|nr:MULTISPECIES: phenylacetate--CoA ligase family protein [unclassified Streptomyces]AGZ94480.1 ATP-dependent synthetase/ligase [Streptomyces sp. WM4235]KOU42090.1 AMP-dependent synthetase [Streptomyces sp. WM4235]MCX5078163.1 phenylacetate--CoA ligase family protein [Streptomyces sp. NBC_00424]